MAKIPMTEGMTDNRYEQYADGYFKKYRRQIEMLEGSPLSKIRSIKPYDAYALGKQLDQYENLQEFKEAEGTVASLGVIPTVAFDVITASYGSSPISALASVQPIDEEQGLIYYKSVYARTSRGNVTAGDRIVSNYTPPDVQPLGFAGSNTSVVIATTAANTSTYSGVLAAKPIRPGSLRLVVQGASSPTFDNSKGVILGRDYSGTINYDTGEVTVDFRTAPAAGKSVTIAYSTDWEAAPDLPRISSGYDTRMITAEVFALKTMIGLQYNFVMRKKFGISAEEDAAADLVATINMEISNNMIVKLDRAASGVDITFPKPTYSATNGISNADYKLGFFDTMIQADNQILSNAGRGNVTSLVAGLYAAGFLATLPGFVKLSAGNINGPHIYGTLNGMTVVRVPDSRILDADSILAIYNGTSPFDSAAIYAPYMPLSITDTLPIGNNPLMSHKGAIVWAGVDVLVPAFITRIKFV